MLHNVVDTRVGNGMERLSKYYQQTCKSLFAADVFIKVAVERWWSTLKRIEIFIQTGCIRSHVLCLYVRTVFLDHGHSIDDS